MAIRLGMGYLQTDSLLGLPFDDPRLSAAHIPPTPMLAEPDWSKIVNYYLDNAPDTMQSPSRKENIKMGLRHFRYQRSKYSHTPAISAMVKILPDNRGVVFSDSKRNINRLTFLTTDLTKSSEFSFEGVPIHYREVSDQVYLATIGHSIFPHHSSDGALYQVVQDHPNQFKEVTPVITGLHRPVDFAYGDLNNDQLEDIVVAEFGNLTGQLVWFEKTDSATYSENVLRNTSGAIRIILKDINIDGQLDILALMAQGDEGIFQYLNKGGGRFEERKLLSFSPLHGSQYMELVDFNDDGHQDILYVCGDNGDKSPILKSYHGVYIYLNDGNFNFTQAYFYQLNGAYKAIPGDYDLDGDVDIASIAFYPDYERYPEESFVYLENRGNLEFIDYSFQESINGRWIVMDAGDMDGDGDIDLALGSNVYFRPKGGPTGLAQKWSDIGPSVVVLENTIR